MGVGVFPQGKEVLVCGLGFRRVFLQRVDAGEAEMGQRAGRPILHDTAAVNKFLELRRCGSTLASSEVHVLAGRNCVR